MRVIANRTPIRKGDMKKGWELSKVKVEARFSFPQSDHAAMETRCVRTEILPNGEVKIVSSSQAPYNIKKLINKHFQVPMENIQVVVSLVGGGFGGKAAVQLEYIAYAASKVVGGKQVILTNSREEDMITSPVHIGLDALVKLGCTKNGKLMAAEIKSVDISKVAALDSTGPYKN